MAKYLVELTDIEIYNVEVEADSEEEAIDAAVELVGSPGHPKAQYHIDSDGDATVLQELPS